MNGFELYDPLVSAEVVENRGLPRDSIPPVNKTYWQKAQNCRYLSENDLIFGLSFDNNAYAFPLKILNWHEVINLQIDNRPFTVTYCPFSGSCVAYIASANQKNLHFGNSGLMYNSNILLYDKETESLWSQMLGQAINGALKGNTLTMLPLKFTTWRQWKNDNKQGQVLSDKTGYQRNYENSPYAEYEESTELWFSTSHKNTDYHPKEPVLTLHLDKQHIAYPFSELAKADEVVVDRWENEKITIHYDFISQTAHAISEDEHHLIPQHLAYWLAWYTFYPNGRVFSATGP